jgi:hypothetical protein
MKKLGKFKMLAIASLLAIALAASIAVAQSVKTNPDNGQRSRGDWQRGRGERKDHGWGGMRGAFLLRLNLTDDQIPFFAFLLFPCSYLLERRSARNDLDDLVGNRRLAHAIHVER